MKRFKADTLKIFIDEEKKIFVIQKKIINNYNEKKLNRLLF